MDNGKDALSVILNNEIVEYLEEDSFENSIFELAYTQIDKERSGILNEIMAACPALAEVVNGLETTEHLKLIFSDEVKKGMETGALKLMERKDEIGRFKAVVVDQAGKIRNIPDIKIDKALQGVDPAQMASAMQGMAIQMQLQDIKDQLEEMSMALNDVLAGQHNDRLAKYFAGVSLYKESLSVKDENLQKELTNSAIMMLSDAYSELSVSLKYSIDSLCSKYNEKDNSFKKIKSDQLCIEMAKINSSFEAIHKTVMLKTAIYYKEGEYVACSTVLNGYANFVEKTLPQNKSNILYLADPKEKTFMGVWNDRREGLPIKIQQVREKLADKANYSIEFREEDIKWNTNVQNVAAY